MANFYTELKKTNKNSNPDDIYVLLPAAGMGTRMRSYGPQPLQKIHRNQTLSEHQIETIKYFFPASTISVVCGFQAERLMNHLPKSVMKLENQIYYNSNVCKSISIGLRAKENCDKLLLIMGDLFFNKEALKHINTEESSIVSSGIMAKGEVGYIVNPAGNILNFAYDLNPKWGQIAYLTGKELELLKKYVFNDDNKAKFAFEALNYIISKGGKIKCVSNPKIKTIDMDHPKDLKYIRSNYENYIRE